MRSIIVRTRDRRQRYAEPARPTPTDCHCHPSYHDLGVHEPRVGTKPGEVP